MQLVRAQNQFRMPLVTAALSVLSVGHRVPVEFHEGVRRFFFGALATESWTHGLLETGRSLRPPPAEPELDRVIVGVFDNLSMKLNYGSYMIGGEAGERKDMTNWFATRIPRRLATPTFDAEYIFRRGFLRTDLSLSEFGRLFYHTHVDIVTTQTTRWRRFCKPCATATTWRGLLSHLRGSRGRSTSRRFLTGCSPATTTSSLSATPFVLPIRTRFSYF